MELKKERLVVLLGLLLIVIASLPIWKASVGVLLIAFFDIALSALFAFVLISIGKKTFGKEMKRYAAFFLSWLAIVQIAVFSVLFFDPLETGIELFLGLALSLLFLSLVFRFLLGKSEAEGTIAISDGDSAAVEMDFDLFAGLNAGKYVVKAGKKYRKGEKVRVKLKRRFFRKEPSEVTGKA